MLRWNVRALGNVERTERRITRLEIKRDGCQGEEHNGVASLEPTQKLQTRSVKLDARSVDKNPTSRKKRTIFNGTTFEKVEEGAGGSFKEEVEAK